MSCCCCPVSYSFLQELCGIKTELCGIKSSIAETQGTLYQIYATLAYNNPMTVAAEYPSVEPDKVVYSTAKARFLDMLNPNMVAIFKGTFSDNLPVYFKDTINYEHIVTLGNINTPVAANQLVNNFPYPALYVANYIVLNPTQQTLDDFKNGLIT